MKLATTWKEIPESELPPEPKPLTVGGLLERIKAENFNDEELNMPMAFLHGGKLIYIDGATRVFVTTDNEEAMKNQVYPYSVFAVF
jgi:hypothetical protein